MSRFFLPRRAFLHTAAMGTVLGSSFFSVPGLFAEELVKTPAQTEGPFYPTKLPLDTDNDLLIINDRITPGVGDITHLTGKVLDVKGNPVRNAVVEIWQCDNKGSYIHSGSDNFENRDKNFQGFGRFTTSSKGEYYFRTIKPVAYPGRSPHIHVKVKRNGKEILTTQCYIKGHPGNAKDGIYRAIKDAKARDSVTIDFTPMKDSKIGELVAQFDIILGVVPQG